jgi:hypothetical protein
LFNGVRTALSGDFQFVRQFEMLLRHAGAHIVSSEVG